LETGFIIYTLKNGIASLIQGKSALIDYYPESVKKGINRKVGTGMNSTFERHGYQPIWESKYRFFEHIGILPGWDWLNNHEHDLDDFPEPTIELIANGKTLSVNGNYKHGVIKDFVKSNRG